MRTLDAAETIDQHGLGVGELGGDHAAKEADTGILPSPPRPSARLPELLPQDPPQDLLQGLPGALQVLPEGSIDEGLVAAAGFVNLLIEPSNHVVVERSALRLN